MAGLSPKLPIVPDVDDGFKLNKTYQEMAIQNLKNTLLTSPGERVMDPAFGVGLRRYLFSHNTTATYMEIEGRIEQQVKKYLPFILIENINFSVPTDGPVDMSAEGDMSDGNFMGIQILFKIIPLGVREILKLP